MSQLFLMFASALKRAAVLTSALFLSSLFLSACGGSSNSNTDAPPASSFSFSSAATSSGFSSNSLGASSSVLNSVATSSQLASSTFSSSTFSSLASHSSNSLFSSSPSSTSTSTSSVADEPVAITIPFTAYAGTTEIKCGVNFDGLGTRNTTATLADFRFYVHNLRLLTNTGVELPVVLDETAVQTANIALLDFRDKLGTGASACQGDNNPARNTQITGKVLIGNNTIGGVRFTLGVPASHNHADQTAAKEPLKHPGLSSGMHWGWNIGYKFTGWDFTTTAPISRPDANTATRWNIHLGSTGCTGSALVGEAVTCTATNRPEISLSDFVVGESEIRLDIADVLAGSDMTADGGGAVGCMSGATDPECAAIFARLGLAHPTQTTAPGQQTAFSVVNK